MGFEGFVSNCDDSVMLGFEVFSSVVTIKNSYSNSGVMLVYDEH